MKFPPLGARVRVKYWDQDIIGTVIARTDYGVYTVEFDRLVPDWNWKSPEIKYTRVREGWVREELVTVNGLDEILALIEDRECIALKEAPT